MKNLFKISLQTILIVILLPGCSNYKKLITDEIVFTDESSLTGTIIKCDSLNIKVKKIDESISIIPWTIIDTVKGKKLKTIWYGVNFGYYNTPYFSVFRNESLSGKQVGVQFKIGLALRGNKLFYSHLTNSPAQPYSITKVGLGYQKYLGNSTYLNKNGYFWGSEFNFMNIKYNNGAQMTLEPYTGFERKLNEYIRLHLKFGLQFNLANKNKQTGVNLTIGVHFLKKNFKKHYEILNKEHRLYK